jgi:hypothetical protein
VHNPNKHYSIIEKTNVNNNIPEIRDEILEDATALGEMGFSPILGSATVAGSPATGSEGDFLSSGLAILKV